MSDEMVLVPARLTERMTYELFGVTRIPPSQLWRDALKAGQVMTAGEYRTQVIRELIEKAETESPYISMDDLIDGRDAFAASVWLKAQMEGE